jgi:hypothetical protein
LIRAYDIRKKVEMIGAITLSSAIAMKPAAIKKTRM